MYKSQVHKHYDDYNIIDIVNQKKLSRQKSPFIGLVRIFENDVLNMNQNQLRQFGINHQSLSFQPQSLFYLKPE